MCDTCKVDKIKEFCKEMITELESYANHTSSDLEEHDCKVAIKEYEHILRFIKDMER